MERISFRVNDVMHSVGSEVDSNTTLLEYLRHTLELRGTKYMCLEGGCGACMVSVTKNNGDAPLAINSCLVSITSCQDWDVTTIEYIGNRLKGYDSLQNAIVESHGTQCGYCTPGWIMAMHCLLQARKPTMLEIEKSFGCNICRCTGYRPILEAFKRFASDATDPYELTDIEDLKICDKSGDKCSSDCSELDWCVVSRNEIFNDVMHIELSDKRQWYSAHSFSDVFAIWKKKGTKSYTFVAGNTGKGAYPIAENSDILIDVTAISELKGYMIDQNLVIGAGNTLTEVMEIFNTVANTEYFSYLSTLNDHLELVAHIAVRNLATIAGNLILKHRYPEFASDLFVIFETVRAEITLMTALGQRKILTLRDFLKEDMRGKIVINVLLPPLSDDYKLVTFKIMPRSQNAHGIVNAGFLYKLLNGTRVISSRIVFGGLSGSFSRALKTERYLISKSLFTNETLQAALRVLDGELVVTQNLPAAPVESRRQIALGLFYKIKCAGEAKYTDDIPKLPEEVYAAFVLTTVALGTIDKVDPSRALDEPGVIAFYQASDIPAVNSFTYPIGLLNINQEEILCNGEVKYYNQPLGIIVAKTQKIADKAATLVKVKYSNVKEPVVDVKLAKNNPAKVTLVLARGPTNTGNDVNKIINGDSTFYGQYHYPLETLVSLAHPTEEGLQIYAATQWMNAVHKVVRRMLNINQNRINVFVRRVGGAFGYKISRISQVAAASALVAYKLNRPCRIINSFATNMRAIGKRFPCSINFEIGVNNVGVIQYMNYDLYSDNGYVVNEPLLLINIGSINNCYRAESWNYRANNVVTDTPSNTWCRAPGSLELIAMMELIMERISYELDVDPIDVRLANLDTNYNELRELLETFKSNAQYDDRKVDIDIFNSCNRWKKRALRFAFLRWTPIGVIYHDVTMSVHNDDGTVSITHGGIEIGQGINTKVTQICAYYLNIPIDKIQINPNDTMISPGTTPTASNLTTENVIIGVRRCCEELLRRLEPIRQDMGNPTWEELVIRAFLLQVDLQVHAFVNTLDKQNYNIFGLTLAKVEIDVLTGESEIKRVDLLQDVGRSINPKVDIGQIEGAFMMGVGYWTSEKLVTEPKTGELLTNRSWDYWVPQARDIPQDFRIYFRSKSFSTELILGAKGTGEPATCMAIAVPIAIRQAIVMARSDCGISSKHWFPIDGPYSVDKIAASCGTKLEDFKFN